MAKDFAAVPSPSSRRHRLLQSALMFTLFANMVVLYSDHVQRLIGRTGELVLPILLVILGLVKITQLWRESD